MHHLHFNALAVAVSGAILWLIGALWYSPLLFAKPWSKLVTVPTEGKGKTMMVGMMASLILDMVLAFVLAHVILWSGADSFYHGALIGFILWMGFFAAPALPQGIYEGRPFKLFAINTGYMLVGLTVIGGVLAVWQ
jgi:hypothetical protein